MLSAFIVLFNKGRSENLHGNSNRRTIESPALHVKKGGSERCSHEVSSTPCKRIRSIRQFEQQTLLLVMYLNLKLRLLSAMHQKKLRSELSYLTMDAE